MVMGTNWKKLVRYLITVLVIFGLSGNVSQACHTDDEAECSNETKKTQTKTEDDEKVANSLEMGLLKDTWFMAFLLFLEKLIERYPIIEDILQMIFD